MGRKGVADSPRISDAMSGEDLSIISHAVQEHGFRDAVLGFVGEAIGGDRINPTEFAARFMLSPWFVV